MITCIEVHNYRSIRYLRRPLESFHVLIGPNASGKTTFLDVISFLSRVVSDGLESAFVERTRNPLDLLWGRRPGSFELAIEARIPADLLPRLNRKEFASVRYEIRVEVAGETLEPQIVGERALLQPAEQAPIPGPQFLFPEMREPPDTILGKGGRKGVRTILNKVPGGNDRFSSEVHEEAGQGWVPTIRLGPKRSAFAYLMDDEKQFPVTTWLKNILREGVQKIVLNSLLIRQASPPGQTRGFKPDGSNLPWVIEDLARRSPLDFKKWLAHLRTALPDLEGIRVVKREDDLHAYLMLRYAGGLEVPSWMASDGTLRLLALTILAYLHPKDSIYLIEEPENGIHPMAVETAFQSLSSVYDSQVLMATHSPVVLAIAEPAQLLCFAKAEDGSTDVVRGDEHPALRDWQGDVNLRDLFAAGVLG